jgi:hypothetical protein
MKKLWWLSLFLFSLLIGPAYSQASWDLGSSQDWLSAGPIYHTGPYYQYYSYYPSYTPTYYWNYYPHYYPSYYPVYNTYYYPYNFPYYYPRHYKDFDHFPLGTFGLFHGGN